MNNGGKILPFLMLSISFPAENETNQPNDDVDERTLVTFGNIEPIARVHGRSGHRAGSVSNIRKRNLTVLKHPATGREMLLSKFFPARDFLGLVLCTR